MGTDTADSTGVKVGADIDDVPQVVDVFDQYTLYSYFITIIPLLAGYLYSSSIGSYLRCVEEQ